MKNWTTRRLATRLGWAAGALAAVSVSAGLYVSAADAKRPAPSLAPSPTSSPAAQPAADVFIPRRQTAPPGPALSPAEAIAKMAVPPGFKVECVASEPLVVNPTSFTWDDRGRIWVTESLEYPRRSPGAGKDRVIILQDTNGDGVMDKQTVFKDGLNIPCGVVIGNGGVYVTNSPDILFLQDTDGDDKADKEEVILTGFGRDDTHELPNSLTWGPDGWLYGMNGVFNNSHVKDPASGKMYDFNCAIWRYHPPTKRFELFSEGTSNPWGLDYDRAGEWFVSCCVIDHLFHMTQSAYYHRQGGPYPPNVQQAKLPSIVTTGHQAAAYAGLCIYDADAFPAEYRGRLFMGNLHGSALNQDVLTPNASTFKQSAVKVPGGKADPNPLNDGKGNLDFLQSNDVWFMPVSQKIGPDGCLYVMDWYDRYHCYQDANRDPAGVERLKGRIYRISHNDTPRAKPFDLQKMSDDELLKLFEHPNVWWRRMAQRVLVERHDLASGRSELRNGPSIDPKLSAQAQVAQRLMKMAFDTTLPNNAHMHAIWALVSDDAFGRAIHEYGLVLSAMDHTDAAIRNWGVRSIGQAGEASKEVMERMKTLATTDPSPGVRVQIAVAAGRLPHADRLPILFALLSDSANAKDPLIPHVVFMNLRPLAATRGKEILEAIAANPTAEKAFADSTVKWIKQTIATSGKGSDAVIADVLRTIKKTPEPAKAGPALDTLIDGLAQLPIEERAKAVQGELRDRVLKYVDDADPAVRVPAVRVALWWQDAKAVTAARKIVADSNAAIESRIALARTLSETRSPGNIPAFAALASDEVAPVRLRQTAFEALGAIGKPESAAAIVASYPKLLAELKPVAINALIRTASGATALLDAIESKTVGAKEVSSTQARSIAALSDKTLTDRLSKLWGAVSTDRDPERVKVVEHYRKVVEAGKGNAVAGWKIFEARCAQCHTIYGKGGTLGPDLTGVGRDDLTAVLTSVLDPNLVIGAPYLTRVARTKDGDVYSGLLVEESPERIVLRDQTQTYAIPRAKLDLLKVQNVSFMPEGLEKQMTDQEFRDLAAFLLTKTPPK